MWRDGVEQARLEGKTMWSRGITSPIVSITTIIAEIIEKCESARGTVGDDTLSVRAAQNRCMAATARS